MVSNNAGYVISEPATLTVSQSNVPISLSLAGLSSGSLQFSLTGENGRNYRIMSSTNLLNWSPEPGFSQMPFLAGFHQHRLQFQFADGLVADEQRNPQVFPRHALCFR